MLRMDKAGARRRQIAAAAAMALLLGACGGGGGGGTAAGAGPAADQRASADAAPPGGGASVPAGSAQQALPNGTYTVTSDAADTVVITLPRNEDLRVGDRVRIIGQGAAPWQLAQNEQQHVRTAGMPGNVVPGATWTARTPDPQQPEQRWSGTASSASGNRVAAIANPGGLHLSDDGGATWTRTSAPTTSWTQVVMSADGSRLAAVGGGVLHLSSDGGQTWTVRGAGRTWHAVHMSDDGRRLVGVAVGAGLQVSTDGGASFTAVPGTADGDWRTVAGSSDGMRLVAVASFYGADPDAQGVYVSDNGGTTWTRRLVAGNWSFAAASADGLRMAVLDNGAYPFVSDDGGATWTQRFTYSAWSGVAVSRDGSVVALQEPRNDVYSYRGYIFLSTTGGHDPWAWTAADLNLTWRGISLSADGNRLVAADHGTPTSNGGRIYTSGGNRTTVGPQGSIGGGAGQAIEVTYQGDGRFTVSDHAGGAFRIR
ncbi:MAG TPA: hypothetical protein VFE82_06680 [Ramlibacter sp.]|jgi:hypothetical protein|uniref:WD40/YVTN/BNR-like repeat-containing protein n=1 Tax=Ramlibacter sp. TaxID=1917967 RepID=UPI002D6399EA|nr:hypothetical protein [Ramlibacter sp.]HZY18151.1 hypothetical protein [Ramlibacter sp.]